MLSPGATTQSGSKRRTGVVEGAVDARAPRRPAVCVALFGSALIHSTVMEEHLALWTVAGFFFLALVAVESALALAIIYAWGRATAQAVVVTGVSTVAVWSISRTVGLPVGPPDFRMAESVGVPDLASCLLELGAAALVWRTAFPSDQRIAGASTNPTRVVDLRTTTVLVLAAVGITCWGLRPGLVPHDGHDAHGGSVIDVRKPCRQHDPQARTTSRVVLQCDRATDITNRVA